MLRMNDFTPSILYTLTDYLLAYNIAKTSIELYLEEDSLGIRKEDPFVSPLLMNSKIL